MLLTVFSTSVLSVNCVPLVRKRYLFCSYLCSVWLGWLVCLEVFYFVWLFSFLCVVFLVFFVVCWWLFLWWWFSFLVTLVLWLLSSHHTSTSGWQDCLLLFSDLGWGTDLAKNCVKTSCRNIIASTTEAGVKKGNERTARELFGHSCCSMCNHSQSGLLSSLLEFLAILCSAFQKKILSLWVSEGLEIPCLTRNLWLEQISPTFCQVS